MRVGPGQWSAASERGFLAELTATANVRAELEAELGRMVPEGYEGPGGSPNRANAMVWALWALLIAPKAEARVRVM